MQGPHFRTAGVAVAAGTTGQLAVVPARGVVLAGQHVQAAGCVGSGVELDVGAAPGHAGGHRDLPGAPGSGHDGGLVGVVQRIQHGVGDAARVQQGRQRQRVADAVAAHQHRPAGGAESRGAFDHGLEQRLGVVEAARRQRAAPAGLVQRHAHHGSAVDGAQFGARFPQRAADAGQAPVALEEALEGGLCHGLGLGRRTQAFLQRHHGVQAARPDPPGRDSAGHLVEQLDGAVLHDVVHVSLVEVQRRQRQQHRLAAVAWPLPGPAQASGQRGQLLFAGGAQAGRAVGGLQRVVQPRHQPARQRQRLPEKGAAGRMRRRARQDQRYLGLVEQDAVGLVEQGPAQAAHQQRGRGASCQRSSGLFGVAAALQALLVAQEVEGQVLGGGVDDVAGVGSVAVGVGLACLQRRHAQAQCREEGRQAGGVAAGQVGVGGDHVHRHTRQCRHRRRKRDGQRLALARGHLGHAVGQQRGGRDVLRWPRRPAQCVGRDGSHGAQRLRRRGRPQTVAPQRAAQRGQCRRSLVCRQLRKGVGLCRAAVRHSAALGRRRAPARPAPGRRAVVVGAHRTRAPHGAGHRQHPGQFQQDGVVHGRIRTAR